MCRYILSVALSVENTINMAESETGSGGLNLSDEDIDLEIEFFQEFKVPRSVLLKTIGANCNLKPTWLTIHARIRKTKLPLARVLR